MNIKFKKLSDKAVIPTKAHPNDAGFDMTAVSFTETEDYIEYGTGIAVEIPENHVGLLFPRSSISKYDLVLCNSVGVLDSNYRGEIKFRFRKVPNPARTNMYLHYKPVNCFQRFFYKLFKINETIQSVEYNVYLEKYKTGDRIGQLIIMPYPEVTFTEVDTLSESDRGEGGFGSTDVTKETKKSKKTKTKRN